MTESKTTKPADLIGCESCGKGFDIETMRPTDEGNYICFDCGEIADAAFNSCKHEWQPAHDSMGDEGYFCPKCSHIVAKEYVDAA